MNIKVVGCLVAIISIACIIFLAVILVGVVFLGAFIGTLDPLANPLLTEIMIGALLIGLMLICAGPAIWGVGRALTPDASTSVTDNRQTAKVPEPHEMTAQHKPDSDNTD